MKSARLSGIFIHHDEREEKAVTTNLEFVLCVFTGNNFCYIEPPFPNGDI